MARIDFSELKQRYVSLEKEALAALTPSILCEAFPGWSARSETGHFWVNRTPLFSAQEDAGDYGDEGGVYIVTVNSIFAASPTMSNFVGESETLLDFITPQVIEYIDQRAHLQSEDYPDAMLYLVRASFETGGYTSLVGINGVAHDAVAFQWRNEFRLPLVQAYL